MSSAWSSEQRQLCRKILLRGNYAEGNFGDDALAIAAQQLLVPGASHIVTEGTVAYRDRRLDHIGCRNKPDELFDAIVYGGGTQFFSFTPDPPAAPAKLLRRIVEKVKRPSGLIDSYHARRRYWIESRTPRLAIGLGIGPFPEASPAEVATANLLKRMQLVWVRDKASMAFCRRYGVENAVRSTDLCFTSAFAKATQKPPRVPERPGRCRSVGIILRDWMAWKDDHFEAAIEAARRMRDQNVSTTFFSLASSDTRLTAALRRHCEPIKAWCSDAESLETFWNALAKMDLVVTSRFHGAVFAALAETPFLAIDIEPKLELVRDWAPSRDSPEVIMSATADPSLIAQRTLTALDEIESRRDATRAMLREQRRLAIVGEQHLANYFDF